MGLSAEEIAAGLHPHEQSVLFCFTLDEQLDEVELLRRSQLEEAQIRSATERLRLKEAIERKDVPTPTVALGEAGARFLKAGVPERRIRDHLKANPGATPAQVMAATGLAQEEWGGAFGELKRRKLVEPDGAGLRWKDGDMAWIEALESALQRIPPDGEIALDRFPSAELEVIEARAKKSRGSGQSWFTRHDRSDRRFILTSLGRKVLDKLEGAVDSPQEAVRQYDFSSPPRIVHGRMHPYRAFLDSVKRRLASLGFEEMTGDLVESEFWNGDALYMPQFHPARAIHDVYHVEGSAGDVGGEVLERVAAAHETGGDTGSRGWDYDFDRTQTRHLVLRSQGTALSSRWMAKKGLKVPGKYFAVARCFRNDTVDATHAPDFFQVEGIVLGPSITLRHLLGLLEVFAREIAQAKELKFLPGYFPYTEPSVEAHILHPTIGWMEMGGAGIFRPEVTRPLGVDVPVIAWGLGLDRMAMVALGISDIRDLFSPDLDLLRSRPAARI